MNIPIAIALLTVICTASAETPLQQLRLRYNKERSDMIVPLNKRYIQSLQGELKRAIGQNDLKTATDINAWIDDLQAETTVKATGGGTDPATGKDVREFFVGSTWIVGTTEFSFSPDGVATKLYRGKAGPVKWVLQDDNTVEITGGGSPEYFFFSSKTRGEHTSGGKGGSRSPVIRKR